MKVGIYTRDSEVAGKRVHRIKVEGTKNSIIVNDEELAHIANYAIDLLDEFHPIDA